MFQHLDRSTTCDLAARDALAWADRAGFSFARYRLAVSPAERWYVLRVTLERLRRWTSCRLERRALVHAWATSARRGAALAAAASCIGCATSSTTAKPLATACSVAAAACAVVQTACGVADAAGVTAGGEDAAP